jgi:hypothetical protein
MLTTSGSQAITSAETTLKEYATETERFVDFLVDLSIMGATDSYTFRVYIKAVLSGDYRLFASDIFTNAQDIPAMYYAQISSRFGAKLTAQKTAGTDRTFDWKSVEVT